MAGFAAGRVGEGVEFVPTPKGGGVRLLTLLDGKLAGAFRSGVASVAPRVEAALGPWVLANRVIESATGSLRLEPWTIARRRFMDALRKRAGIFPVLLITDVRSCYPSILPEHIEMRLRTLGCLREDVDRLVGLLRSFERMGVRGLPVGPEPSAVIANAVLEVADRAVAAEGAEHLRWVDDFVVFTDGARRAKAVLDRLRETLAGLGLSLADDKTRLADGPDLARAGAAGLPLSDLLRRT